MKRASSFRKRLLVSVSALVFVTAAVFSLYTLVFTYGVEDAFLAARLQEEASHQLAVHERTGTWSAPRDSRLQLHEDSASLPASVRERLNEEPRRIEFPGPAGSHYHLQALSALDGTRAWLLYDAGADLLVPAIRNKLLMLLAITALLLLVCALAVGYLISRRITQRLDVLTANVRDYSPEQLPASLSQINGDDEVGIVAASLNTLSKRLQAFVSRERGFTRDASHELRTPLSVIRSASEQLQRQSDLSAASRAHAMRIQESSMQLEQIVAALLTLAREESPGEAAASTVLLPLIEQTVIEQSTRLGDRPIEVEVQVASDARLQAPETVTRILLANLIGNAFAHTSAGRVRIEADADTLRISNSKPIPPDPEDAAAHLPSPATDGFGFGLDIVQRLCDRFGLTFRLSATPADVTASLQLASSGRQCPA